MTTSEPVTARSRSLTRLSEGECWDLLDTTTVGRVAFSSRQGIVLLPVNFFVHRDRIYLRTEPGSTLAELGRGHDDVAFEIDHHDGLNQTGWNVLVRCRATLADTVEGERAMAGTSRLGPWAPGDRAIVIRLTPRSIGGRRVALG